MRESDFTFDSVQLFYYKCHKVNFKRGVSFIDFSNWIKKNNTGDECFQFTVTIALNYREIKRNPEKVLNIKQIINKYQNN